MRATVALLFAVLAGCSVPSGQTLPDTPVLTEEGVLLPTDPVPPVVVPTMPTPTFPPMGASTETGRIVIAMSEPVPLGGAPTARVVCEVSPPQRYSVSAEQVDLGGAVFSLEVEVEPFEGFGVHHTARMRVRVELPDGRTVSAGTEETTIVTSAPGHGAWGGQLEGDGGSFGASLQWDCSTPR